MLFQILRVTFGFLAEPPEQSSVGVVMTLWSCAGGLLLVRHAKSSCPHPQHMPLTYGHNMFAGGLLDLQREFRSHQFEFDIPKAPRNS